MVSHRHANTMIRNRCIESSFGFSDSENGRAPRLEAIGNEIEHATEVATKQLNQRAKPWV